MSRHTVSGIELADWYGPDTVDPTSFGPPGHVPYTRGISPVTYADVPWVIGQYGGFGTASETNARFRELLAQGQSGFSVALDLPTQLGMDSDDPRAAGEVGRVGVAIDSLADLELLFDGIPLKEVRQIRTTANSMGHVWLALIVAFAERQDVDPDDIAILIQNDVLKEYIARGTQIFEPKVGLDLVAQMIQYTTERLPRWTPLSISGYHIRETGGTAIEELAFTFANAIAYLDAVVARDVDVDAFASKLFMFFSVGIDVVEEIAKFRAARTMWNTLLADRYQAADTSRQLRIFAYTAGSNLTAESPYNNVVRTTLGAFAAVCGGAQTINTSCYDEALGTPTLAASTLAIRTQQIILEESGLANLVDPFGGSWAVEHLTAELQRRSWELVDEVSSRGGALACIDDGWMADRLQALSYEHLRAVDRGERRIVGVNCYRDDTVTVPAFSASPEAEVDQVSRLAALRRRRDQRAVDAAVAEIERAAIDGRSVIEPTIAAMRVYATIGEVCEPLRRVHGDLHGTRPKGQVQN